MKNHVDMEARLRTLLENAISYIREHTENLDEMDYQAKFVEVLTEEIGMSAEEIYELTGIDVEEE